MTIRISVVPVFVILATSFGTQAQQKCVNHPELPGNFFGTFVLDEDKDDNYMQYLNAQGIENSTAEFALQMELTKAFRPALSEMPNRYDLEEWNDKKTVIYSNWALGEIFDVVGSNKEKFPVEFSLNGTTLKEQHSSVGIYQAGTFEYSVDGDELVMKVKNGGVEAKRYFKRQKEVCAEQDVPEKFLGTFVLDQSMDQNYVEHLRARGFPEATISFVKSQLVTKVIRRAKSEKPHRFDMRKITPMVSILYDEWALGEQFNGVSLTGKPLRVTFTASDDNNTLIETRMHKTPPYEKDVIDLTVEGDYLVMTNIYKGVETKRYYKRVPDESS